MGCDKEEINLTSTNIFDWRRLKEKNFDYLIDLISNFQYAGLKDEKEYKKY